MDKVNNCSILLTRFTDYLYLEKGLAQNTIESYKSDLALYIAYVHSKEGEGVCKAGQNLIMDYLAFCQRTGISHRTISRYLSAIRAFYAYLIEEHIISKDPTVNIATPKIVINPPEYLTLEEVELLLSVPDEGSILGLRDRAIIELMYSCGLRVSEVTSLKIGNINFHESYILVLGKGGKERFVPFGERARSLLERYIDCARGDLLKGRLNDSLFLNYRGEPLSRKGVWKFIKEYALRSGIKKNIKPHILRHSFGAHLIQNGADLRLVQELLGHADIATTQIYTHLDRGTLIDIHNKYHPLSRFKA
jgi:integrase/recombinase XerD